MKYNALADDEESSQCFLGGLIIRNLSIWLDFFPLGFVIFGILKEILALYLLNDIFFCSTSNWRCKETLEEYLIKRNIMGICK